jgi:AcrR family transcriptional regulator
VAKTGRASTAEIACRWQRARRPEHKLERREAILRAAVAVLDEAGVEGTTLSAIARAAGLSKANCYRYYESREAILLAVALDEAAGWTDEILAGLARLAGTGDLDAAAEVFVRATAARPRLCRLVSSLASVLETNVGPAAVADVKQGFHRLLTRSVVALCAALPALTLEAGRDFAALFTLLVAGAWPAAHPTPVVAEVLARREFADMRVDFASTLRTQARASLRGLIAEQAQAHPLGSTDVASPR